MPTVSTSRENCQGSFVRAGDRKGCFTTNYTIVRPRRWISNAADLIAKADSLGLEPADLLCRGCETRRQRLIAEGTWPA